MHQDSQRDACWELAGAHRVEISQVRAYQDAAGSRIECVEQMIFPFDLNVQVAPPPCRQINPVEQAYREGLEMAPNFKRCRSPSQRTGQEIRRTAARPRREYAKVQADRPHEPDGQRASEEKPDRTY